MELWLFKNGINITEGTFCKQYSLGGTMSRNQTWGESTFNDSESGRLFDSESDSSQFGYDSESDSDSSNITISDSNSESDSDSYFQLLI